MVITKNTKIFLGSVAAVLVCGSILYYVIPVSGSVKYSSGSVQKDTILEHPEVPVVAPVVTPELAPVTHITTPAIVKAVYVSSWTAGSAKNRDRIIKLIDETELNAIVVDIKDSTGRIGFTVADQNLQNMGTTERRIPNVRTLTNMLHEKNIYIIGRVAVFQDPYLAKKKPEWAITRKSDGLVWKDHKGLSFLDPSKKEVWDYTVAIARDAYAEGFDEINFDYIRYPSDGDIKNMNYHLAEGKTRADNIEAFFKYLHQEVKKDVNIPMSADLFGLTTEARDDMGIGQLWEKALPYFDFLAPMIYPSHYPPGQNGFKNPADHPYEIIHTALVGAITKTKAQNTDIHKIRPWLQDFNLGAVYTKDKVQAQMKASNDLGLTSWMLWDANNKYTPSALAPAPSGE